MADMDLIYVHVVHRHGERTPVKKRLGRAGIPPVWNMCSAAKNFYATVLESTGELAPKPLNFERYVQSEERKGVRTIPDGACLSGELTDKGRMTTSELGKRLRSEYVLKQGLLEPGMNPDALYLRSSNMSRTIESLQEVLHGLYPLTTRPPNTKPKVVIRDIFEENLFPNTTYCKRLRDLDRGFADAAAKIYNPKLKDIQEKLSPYVDEIRVDGHPRLSGILDTVNAAKGNGLKLPPEFDEQTIRRIEEAVVFEWFSGYLKSEEYKRLAAGRLATEIKDIIVAKAQDKNSVKPLKMSIYSAHDTTLASLLLSFGWFDWRWPTFTSYLTLELWKDKNVSIVAKYFPFFAKQSTYVRTSYNGKPVVLERCKIPGGHRIANGKADESMCTLAAFSAIVEELRIKDWEQECERKPT